MTKAAKRRKEKEGPDFAFPEFDEAAYMRKEVEGAKAAVITVILAVPVAALLYGLAVSGLAVVAFFLGLALTFALPRLFRMLQILPWPKVDTAKFERRDWIGHGSTFFFSWLAFWILLLNAPFVDLTDPVIGVTAWAGGLATVGMQAGVVTNTVDQVNSTAVQFNVTILENVGVVEATITIEANTSSLVHAGGALYTFEYAQPLASFDVEVYARDPSGNEARFSFPVQLLTR